VEPVYREIGPEFKKDAPLVIKVLEEHQEDVARGIVNNGFYETEVNGKRIRIEPRHVRVRAEYPDWLKVRETKYGIVGLDLRVSREEELEGIARDIVRRIQFMRKELRLDVNDYIKVWIESDDDDVKEAIEKFESYIKGETRATEIHVGTVPAAGIYSRSWDIEEKKLLIGISKA